MARICKYGCGTMLEGFDEDKRRYIEYGTTDCLHTKERCQEAKSKKEQKNDHGNEDSSPPISPKEYVERFVDHTAKGVPRFIAFESTSADLLTKHANDWVDEQGDEIQVKLIGQLQVDNGKFAIALYYEEVK